MLAFSVSWAARDDLSDAVLTGGNKKNCGYARFALRFCRTARFWALPVFTYIVARSLGMKGCIGADIILFCLRTVRVLFGPLHRHLGDVLTHGTSSAEAFWH